MFLLSVFIPNFFSDAEMYIDYCEMGKGDVLDECLYQLKHDAIIKIVQWSEIAFLGILLFFNKRKHNK